MGADQPLSDAAAHPLTLPETSLRLPILGLQALIALRLAMLAATAWP